jgi:type IV secretion system protein VirD4
VSSPAAEKDDLERIIALSAAAFGALLLGVGGIMHVTANAAVRINGGSYKAGLSDTVVSTARIALDPARPERAFGAYAAYLPHGPMFYAAFVGPLLVGITATTVAIAVWRRAVKRRRDDEGAVWATRRDLKPLVVTAATPARGVLGKTKAGLIATEDNMSTIVFGPTQSGKSSGYAIPRVLEHHGPSLVLSVKTDLARNTFAERDRIGKVYVYDPTNATNLPNRIGWTPLRRCLTWGGAKRTAKWLAGATTTRSDAGGGNEAAEFFKDRARKMLAPLMFAAARNNLTMGDVVRWIEEHSFDEPRDLLATSLDPAGYPGGAAKLEQHIADALRAHKAIHSADGREISSTYSTCEQILEAYTDPLMEDCTIDESVDPADLLTGANTLYVCAPSTEQDYLRPIFATIIKDVISEAFDQANANGGSLDLPLLVVLDELANLARIPDLDTLASTCASHGICLVSILQSYAQLVDKWGSSRAATIVDNHRAKVLLKGSTDRLLLEHFARLLGDEAVEQTSSTQSRGGTSTTESTRYRPLAALHQLRSLPDNTGLLLYGNLPPTKLELRPYFDDPVLRHMARPIDAEEPARA